MLKDKRVQLFLTTSTLVVATYFGVESWKIHFFNKFFLKTPNLQGYTLGEVESLGDKYGFKIEQIGSSYSSLPQGLVFKQSPVDGISIKQGNKIQVFVSKGVKKNLVPKCNDISVDEAVTKLSNAGIKISKKMYDENSMFEDGKVIATDPPIGYESWQVKMLVSGSEHQRYIFVPDVIGLDVEIAKKNIEKSGFQVGKVQGHGCVTKTIPESFSQSVSGSFIDIFSE